MAVISFLVPAAVRGGLPLQLQERSLPGLGEPQQVRLVDQRGICPQVVVLPGGRHRSETAEAIFPDFCKWILPRVAPYAPGGGK